MDPAKDRVHVYEVLGAAGEAEAGEAGSGGSGKGPAPAAGQVQGKGGPKAVQGPVEGATGRWRPVPLTAYQDARSKYYFALNKPKGYICSSADVSGRGRRAVDLLEPWLEGWKRKSKDKKALPPRLFTVGRLDVASSGLLLVTNDGDWANKVIHPSSGVTKEYQVTVSVGATRSQLEKLAAGTEVAGTQVVPLEVEVLGDPRRLRVVVQEGKKHEVRELVKAAGLDLTSLKRVRIGGFRLPADLGLGGYRELRAEELRAVTDLRAQDAASVSGATRQAAQEAAQAWRRQAARRAVHSPALQGVPEEVLDEVAAIRAERIKRE